MDDLISRQALITKLNHVIEHGRADDRGRHMLSAEKIKDAVERMPSVEPLGTMIDDILVAEKKVDINDVNDYLEKIIDLVINVTVLFFFLAVIVGVMICITYVTFLMINKVGLL